MLLASISILVSTSVANNMWASRQSPGPHVPHASLKHSRVSFASRVDYTSSRDQCWTVKPLAHVLSFQTPRYA